jgi:hypothetical protein
MKNLQQHLVQNRKQINQLAAASAVAYGVLIARLILQNEKTLSQAEYLATIVSKNMDKLDEFDIIALTDLGLIKPPKND